MLASVISVLFLSYWQKENAGLKRNESESESRSVMSNSLGLLGLYSPWNSPGQNTEIGSCSLLQGIFPTQGSKPGLPHCRRILYQLSQREAQEYWSGQPISSPMDLPDPGIKLKSPVLQADTLQTELSGKLKRNSLVNKEVTLLTCIDLISLSAKMILSAILAPPCTRWLEVTCLSSRFVLV